MIEEGGPLLYHGSEIGRDPLTPLAASSGVFSEPRLAESKKHRAAGMKTKKRLRPGHLRTGINWLRKRAAVTQRYPR
jgi:hypothetical protein